MRVLVLASLMFIIACGGSGSGSGSSPSNNQNLVEEGRFIEAKSIDREFSPKAEEVIVMLEDGVKKVHLAAVMGGVRLRRDKNVNLGSFIFRQITVVKNGFRPEVSPNRYGDQINLSFLVPNGQYSCSMTSVNDEVTSVEGGCLVSLEVRVNPAERLEIYYQDKLLSKAFWGMGLDVFEQRLNAVSYDKEKHQVVKSFVGSYKATGTKLILDAELLDHVLGKFTYFSEFKIPVFSLLHAYIKDRETLRTVIEDNFSFAEREKVFAIAGLKTES